MVHQHYRLSEKGKAGMFWLQQVLLDFFFHHDLVAQYGSEQDWSASQKESYNNKLTYNIEENPKLGHNHRYVKCLIKGSILKSSLRVIIVSSLPELT